MTGARCQPNFVWSSENRQKVREMAAQEHSAADISRAFNGQVSANAIKGWLWRHGDGKRSRVERKAIIPRKDIQGAESRSQKIDPAVVARLTAAIPPDTRTLTARMLGDPIPGRSALDRRRPKLFIGSV